MLTVPVYVIALNSKWESRGSKVVEHFSKCTLVSSVNRFPAVTPSNFVLHDVAHPSAMATINSGLERQSTFQLSHPNQVGCAMSHISLWRICLALQTPIIVAEDDARPKMLTRRIKDMLTAPLEADLVILQCSWFPFKTDKVPYSMCGKVRRFWGTGCYYLTPLGAGKLLKHALPVVMHVDAYIESLIFSGLQIYSVPGCNDQDHSDTTLNHNLLTVLQVTSIRQPVVFSIVFLAALIVIAVLAWRLWKRK